MHIDTAHALSYNKKLIISPGPERRKGSTFPIFIAKIEIKCVVIVTIHYFNCLKKYLSIILSFRMPINKLDIEWEYFPDHFFFLSTPQVN